MDKLSTEFSTEQLEKALYDFEDLMVRAVIPFVCLDYTAKAIFDEQPLSGSCVSVGLRDTHVDNFVKYVFDTYTTHVVKEDGSLEYEVEGVPVKVTVYPSDTEYMQYPDLRIYGPTQFNLPNPFLKYWEARI